jgi:subfamily B ATP-binding cassette protein MsbA
VHSRLFAYIGRYRRELTLSVLCMGFLALTSGVSLGMIIPLVNALFRGGEVAFSTGNAGLGWLLAKINAWLSSAPPMVTLGRLAGLIALVYFLKGFFTYMQRYFSVVVEQGTIRDLREAIYRHLHTLSLSFFHARRTGVLTSRITNDVSFIQGAIDKGFVALVREALLAVVYVGVVIWASWKLAVVAILVVPASAFLIILLGKKLRKSSHRVQEAAGEITSTLTETVSGIRVVKAFSMQDFEIKKFAAQAWEYYRAFLKFERISMLASPLTEFLGVVAACIILLYGGRQILVTGELTPDRFIVFLAASLSLMQPIKRISHANTTIQHGLAASARIFSVIDTVPDVRDADDAVDIDSFNESLCFENVSFEYEKGRRALVGVDLTIKVGEVVALVGPSGAGKSTIADLASRFYDVTEGRVSIDGTDLRSIRVDSLRGLMGIVTQETILFNDTVRNNIAYGRADAPLEEVERAARAANIHDFVLSLPQGYDTRIGERGVRLSGGERQRIAIARAILKNPPILILDEATSALDTQSEMLVQEALDRLMEGRTSIVIAHRLSTIRRADKIVVVVNGEVKETGTHETLMSRGGTYRSLYELQFAVDREERVGTAAEECDTRDYDTRRVLAVMEEASVNAVEGSSLSETGPMIMKEAEAAEVLRALEEMTVAMQSTLRLEQVLKEAMRLIRSRFSYLNIAVLLLEDDGRLTIAAHSGYEDVDLSRAEDTLAGKNGITWAALRELRPILVPDTAREPRYVGPRKRSNSEIAAPLRVKERVLGVLDVEKEGKDSLGPKDVRVLRLIASRIALAVENARLYHEKEMLAITDDLTGIENYRYFRERLAKEIDEAAKGKRQLSLLMLDVDDFKEHNDAFGHQGGDWVLRELATVLKTNVGDAGSVTRYGGDEFMVILPGCGRDEAVRVGESLRRKVEEFSGLEDGPDESRFTISVGVAVYPGDAPTGEELVNKVDAALYRAKQSGKNRVST